MSRSPLSFQTTTVLVVKFLRRKVEGAGEDKEDIYGKVMLIDGEVKLNRGGRTVVVKVCRTEEERVAALEEYFGIVLVEREMSGIRGWKTELQIEEV